MNDSVEPISLADVPPDDTINLNGDGQSPLPSEATAVRRGTQAGLGMNQDPANFISEIQSGNEAAVRDRVARQKDIEFHDQKLDVIRKVASDRVKAGGEMSQQEMDFIVGMSRDDFKHDPNTIFETQYAKDFFKKYASKPQSILSRAVEERPQETGVDLDIASNVKARMEVAKTIHENLEDRKHKLSKFETVTTYGSNLLFAPLESYRLHNVVGEGSSLLPGKNLGDQVRYMWTLPPSEFQKTLTKVADDLAKKNVLTAQKFVESVISYGSGDEHLDNVFGIVGLSDIPAVTGVKLAAGLVRGVREGAARGGAKAAGDAVRDVKTALKDGVKAEASVEPVTAEAVAEATGDIQKSSMITALKDAQARFAGQDPLAEAGRMVAAIPGLFNIQRIVKGVEFLGREAAERVSERLQKNAAGLMDSVTDPSNVNRVTGPALETAFKSTEKEVKEWYPHLNDVILDTHYVREEKNAAHVNEVELQVGKRVQKQSPNTDYVLSPAPGGVRKVAGVERQRFDIQGKDGHVGHADIVYVNKTEAFIDNITVNGGANSLGPAATRSLLKQFREMNPDVKVLSGDRWTGARGKNLGENFDGGNMIAVKLPEVNVAIGTPEATLFKSRDEAYTWGSKIYKLSPQEYTIGQKGDGFYISVRKGVDETKGEVRDQLMIQTGHQSPQTVFTTFLSRLRTANDLLSETQNVARNAVTHGSQELHRYAVETAEAIGGLSNKSKKKLLTVLQKNRDETYKEGDKLRKGVFYENFHDLETNWKSIHGVSPTEKEALAYFSAIQLNSWEWMIRNLGLYRDKTRLGIERFRFEYRGFNEESKSAEMFQSNYIEGRLAKGIDFTDQNHAGLWVYDKGTNEGKWFDKTALTGTEKADIEKKINEEGYRIIQVANPMDKPVQKISGELKETVNFVIVPAAERAPLDWNQLPMRPGGHIEFMHDHWVKQPSMRLSASGKHHYEGDVSITNHATEAEARQFARDMDIARILLKENKTAELDAHLAKTLPWDRKKWSNFFKAGDKGEDARLALDTPIFHTSSGTTVYDTHGTELSKQFPDFRDDIRSHYNLFGLIDKKYANEREASVLDTIKSHTENGKPLFRLEEARLIDPLTSMNKGLANAMRSRFMADYKWKSVEDFIQEFHDVMNVTGGLEALRKDPVFYLHNAPWNTAHPDKAKLQAGKNAQRAVLELLGTESETQLKIGWMQEKVLNTIYEKLGQKASDFTAEHLLPFEKDPLKWLRSVGFHSKLGVFNPVQLFLQAQTLTHIAAVSGVGNAVKGASGALLMRWANLTRDPKILDGLAEKATAFGWKKQDWLEAYDHLKKSGLWNIEGEVAFKDDFFDPKLFMGVVGKFFDKGTVFFREGERMTRLSAWNAAYHEWKVANPGKVLDSEARNSILTRQNTLTVNMTRASNAWWQNGIMSVPTQFFAYQARLMEQFMGKRLTTSEKAHAFGVYSAMYGVPGAIGAAAGVWPWYEDLRQAALDNDIDVNSPGIKGLMEGIPSLVWSTVTGDDRNWAQQFGPRGLSFFKDLLVKGKVDVLFGASASIIGDMVKSSDPIARGMMSVFSPESEKFEFIAEDFINAVENVATLNNLGKMMFALNTHRFISKNEVYLKDATTLDAVMAGITGTQPQILADAYIKQFSLSQTKKAKDEIAKEVIKNFRRGLEAGHEDDWDSMSKNMRNARLLMIGGGFKPDEQAKVFKDAINGYESFVDKIQRQWVNEPKRFNKMFNLPEEKN